MSKMLIIIKALGERKAQKVNTNKMVHIKT